jgi:hypothetical protein
MTARILRIAFSLCAFPPLTACAPLMAIIGYGGPAVQLAAQVDRIKLIGDGVAYVGTGKTISDHALSMAMHADCRVLNVVTHDAVCEKNSRPAETALINGPDQL